MKAVRASSGRVLHIPDPSDADPTSTLCSARIRRATRTDPACVPEGYYAWCSGCVARVEGGRGPVARAWLPVIHRTEVPA